MAYVNYHPVYLDLNDRAVLIVGGGKIALEKLDSLLPRSGARITVLSPELEPEVADLHAQGKINWIQKVFDEPDVEPYFMIIAATDNPEVNARVFRAGNALLRLTNSVDDPTNCNFIMAAIVAHGPMQVAVSSAGCSPALAQRIRKRISEEILKPEDGDLGAFLGEWRPEVKDWIVGYRGRKGFWERALASGVPITLSEKGREAADTEMRCLLHTSCLGKERCLAGKNCDKGAACLQVG